MAHKTKGEKPQRRPKTLRRILPPPPRCVHNQAQCALLTRLPAEVRLMIWKAVIGGLRLHILRSEHKLSHLVCTNGCPGNCSCGDPYYFSRHGRRVRRTKQSLPSILKTCWRVYSEAVSILYTSTMFDCMDPSTIQYLQGSILPDRWIIIQSVQVRWDWLGSLQTAEDGSLHYCYDKELWESICRTIKSLKALRHFSLVLKVCQMGCNPEAMRSLLEPLKDLRLKYPWELKLRGPQDDLHQLDTGLKAAGFDCIVRVNSEHNQNGLEHSTPASHPAHICWNIAV